MEPETYAQSVDLTPKPAYMTWYLLFNRLINAVTKEYGMKYVSKWLI